MENKNIKLLTNYIKAVFSINYKNSKIFMEEQPEPTFELE